MKRPIYRTFYPLILPAFFVFSKVHGQMITGVWKGKINRQNVELKIIQRGDSLVGTSYYYETANNYRRYSIRGYFDPNTNSTVWWDDQLLDERSGRFSIGSPGKIPMLSRADFNCPGGGKMILNGKAYDKDEEDKIKGTVDLDKTSRPESPPEKPIAIVPVQTPSTQRIQQPKTSDEKTKPVAIVEKPAIYSPDPLKPLTIEEKFVSRKKILLKDIPLNGDSIELRFYDNGEIDGDSISLFLNDQLIFSHLLLTGQAHIMKLAILFHQKYVP